MATKIKARLVRSISYNRLNGSSVMLVSGTEIVVDINSPDGYIAYAKGDHFSIDENEFVVLYIN